MSDGEPTASRAGQGSAASARAQIAWCFYDWANSAFPTVIVTFVFAAYFTQAVAATPAEGTAQWGWAVAGSALLVAVASPVLGAIADAAGRRKPWLAGFSIACAVLTAGLWLVTPTQAAVPLALVLFALANAAFELGTVFYNAMLPGLAPPDRVGRLSGWGWGLGYAGGLVCLVVVLFGLIEPRVPPFGLDKAAAEPVRAAALLTAAWFALFAAPIFLFTPDAAPTGAPIGRAVARGLRTLADTFRRIGAYRVIAWFLIAKLFYIDGLNTLFAFGGIYAAGTFGMTTDEIIVFGIALNVAAGLGAAGFAWVDDWIGAKRTIMIALAGVMAFGTPLLLVQGKIWFWALAIPLGVFFGPAQAASRSLMARLAPEALRTEMFGLSMLSGRISAFAGPAVLAWATAATGSQRVGMATILGFVVIGFALLVPVREPKLSPSRR
jgi:MFS transporter, UMF1 family